jgi:hypothetical protein
VVARVVHLHLHEPYSGRDQTSEGGEKTHGGQRWMDECKFDLQKSKQKSIKDKSV